MNIFLTIILTAIGLSMDAFSLSLVYGMWGMGKKEEILLSIIVGLFHFFMPLIGLFVGNIFISFLNNNCNYLIDIIFFLIGIEMIISSFIEKEINIINGIVDYLLFGFSVSVDSFTVGIGLNFIYNNYLLVSFIFMVFSGIFTFLGLFFGNKIKLRYGNISKIIGGFILIILSFCYFFSFFV